MEQQHFFLTVDWCNKGHRGIFCDARGKGHWLPDRPYTKAEMCEILGPFWLILDPECTAFTEAEMAKYTTWYPLDEYSGQFGIVMAEGES